MEIFMHLRKNKHYNNPALRSLLTSHQMKEIIYKIKSEPIKNKTIMKNMYRILVVVYLLGNIGYTNAQTNDHLKPVSSIYDIYDFQFEYYSKVRKILFEGLTDSPEIRFQIMPSFTPENVLDIEFERESNTYYLVYHICEKMIWYNEKWDHIKVDKYRTKIEEESVELIKSLFTIAISQTRFPDKETRGFDGENYYFSINDFGLKTGEIWTPMKGTKMRKLVDIGYELIELAKSKEESVKIDNGLRKNIENLMGELKENE